MQNYGSKAVQNNHNGLILPPETFAILHEYAERSGVNEAEIATAAIHLLAQLRAQAGRAEAVLVYRANSEDEDESDELWMTTVPGSANIQIRAENTELESYVLRFGGGGRPRDPGKGAPSLWIVR
jgi:hypothetical protein